MGCKKDAYSREPKLRVSRPSDEKSVSLQSAVDADALFSPNMRRRGAISLSR